MAADQSGEKNNIPGLVKSVNLRSIYNCLMHIGRWNSLDI